MVSCDLTRVKLWTSNLLRLLLTHSLLILPHLRPTYSVHFWPSPYNRGGHTVLQSATRTAKGLEHFS